MKTPQSSEKGMTRMSLGGASSSSAVQRVVKSGCMTCEPNPPIAGYDRQYGFTTPRVTMKASAFAAGMKAAGVATSWKHFPGLGRVTANTDTTKHVKDTVTTTTSPAPPTGSCRVRTCWPAPSTRTKRARRRPTATARSSTTR